MKNYLREKLRELFMKEFSVTEQHLDLIENIRGMPAFVIHTYGPFNFEIRNPQGRKMKPFVFDTDEERQAFFSGLKMGLSFGNAGVADNDTSMDTLATHPSSDKVN